MPGPFEPALRELEALAFDEQAMREIDALAGDEPACKNAAEFAQRVMRLQRELEVACGLPAASAAERAIAIPPHVAAQPQKEINHVRS